MRIRRLVVVALLAVPVGLTAQTRPPVTRVPPPPPPPQVRPPEPSPQPAAVSRELRYRRSRWSGEAYSLITNGGIPDASGAFTRFTSLGNGMRGDYRYTDHWSASIDMTASYLFSPAISQTGEVGARYAPLPLDRELRPFFDARLGFMHLYDTYLTGGLNPTLGGGFADNDYTIGARYSRGFGAGLGTGLEFPLTQSLQLTSELSAMRNRMTTYRISGGLPDDRSYWMTAFRFSIGVKLNPVQTLHLDQNPMK